MLQKPALEATCSQETSTSVFSFQYLPTRLQFPRRHSPTLDHHIQRTAADGAHPPTTLAPSSPSPPYRSGGYNTLRRAASRAPCTRCGRAAARQAAAAGGQRPRRRGARSDAQPAVSK